MNNYQGPRTFGGPLRDEDLNALERYRLSIVVGLQASAAIRRNENVLGAMLAYIVAEAAGAQAQNEAET